MYRYNAKVDRYQKHFVPLVFILGMEEDAVNYSLLLELATQALILEFRAQGKPLPERMFYQFHSDFAASSQRALREARPDIVHVNDLEHLDRALTAHQTKGEKESRYPGEIKAVIAYCFTLAYVYNLAAFSLFWETMLGYWKSRADTKGFAKYFEDEYLQPLPLPGGQSGFKASWWCGATSKVRAGFPSTQNMVESFMSMLRRLFASEGHHIDPVPLLNKMETKCVRWCTTPGETFSIAGPGQRLCNPPIPLQSSLTEGEGRVIKFTKKTMAIPSVRQIFKAFQRTSGATIYQRTPETGSEANPGEPPRWKHFFMEKEKPAKIDKGLAERIWAVYRAPSMGALGKLWERHGIFISVDGQRAVDWDKFCLHYRRYAYVRVDRSGQARCSCELFSAESACSHSAGVLECFGDEGDGVLDPELPISSGGRGGPVPRRAAVPGARTTQEAANAVGDRRAAKRRKTGAAGDESADVGQRPAGEGEAPAQVEPALVYECPSTFLPQSFGHAQAALSDVLSSALVGGIEAEVLRFFAINGVEPRPWKYIEWDGWIDLIDRALASGADDHFDATHGVLIRFFRVLCDNEDVKLRTDKDGGSQGGQAPGGFCGHRFAWRGRRPPPRPSPPHAAPLLFDPPSFRGDGGSAQR